MKKSIYQFNHNQLEQQLLGLGIKKYNSKIILDWIYKKHVYDFEKMTNLSKDNQKILNSNFDTSLLNAIKILKDETDETVKFLFKLSDEEVIETVIMKFNYGYVTCISSQVGCNMGCKFCASGLLKKKRSLSIEELVLQYVTANSYLQSQNGERISGIVVMGIGEPLDNLENLIPAMKILIDPHAANLGQRHISLSTCGIVNQMEKLANELPQLNLCISLHGSNDDLRNKIMPINKKYNLKILLESVKQYIKITNRRICFQYILLDDVNDSDTNAIELANLLKNINAYVNVIPFNSVDESGFKQSKRAKEFMDVVNKHGVRATLRKERGTKIDAACGQLRAKYDK